ncbi:MAG: PilZ domain-containing protein [Acidobacteriota bacterium]
MTDERRKHQRVMRPFDGTFSGASGATRCRITDISVGGCFIQSLAAPTPGDTTSVNVIIGNHSLSFPGLVVYVDSTIGFAVQFKDIPAEELDELSRLLAALDGSKASA